MAADARSSFLNRGLQGVRTHPWLLLAVGSLWTVFLPLVYGLVREPHSYQRDMLGPGLGVALVLFLAGWAWVGLYFLLALGLGLLNAVYAHIAHFWRIGNLEIRVETALDTSPGESAAFIERFVLRSKFAWALLGYLAVALAWGGLYLYLRSRRGSSGTAPRRGLRVMAFGLAVALAVGLGPSWGGYPALLLAQTTYRVYTRVNPILERKQRVAAFLAQAPPLACDAPYDKIVFVLGESANRDYMHLYGYPLPTTPFLDHLEGKVVARAIAPVNQTMAAVPILLTPATVTDYERFYQEPSVVSDLRRCGYETFWFSNQLRYSPYTSSVSSIASEADQVRFVLDDLPAARFGLPDEVLLQFFTPEVIVPGRKQAFFLHLLGSHFEWQDRYPPEQALIPEPEDLRQIYANTIYYTDRVLAAIWERMQARGSRWLFVYTSDHGEWITPTEGGHAFSHAFQDEYRVPLIWWASASDPRLERLNQAYAGHLVNTETLDLQLRYVLGIEDDPGVSYSPLVLSLGPGRVRNYYDLPYLEQPDKP